MRGSSSALGKGPESHETSARGDDGAWEKAVTAARERCEGERARARREPVVGDALVGRPEARAFGTPVPRADEPPTEMLIAEPTPTADPGFDEGWAAALRSAKESLHKRQLGSGGATPASFGDDRQSASGDGERARAREPSAAAAPSGRMLATREWMKGPTSRVDPSLLRTLVDEIVEVNRARWSPETEAAIAELGAVEGESLDDAFGRMGFDAVAARARHYRPLDDRSGGDPGDPLDPDVGRLESRGVNHRSREGRERVYSEGSKPKIRTALNRWFQFVHDEAKVGPLRPRIHESQPEQFVKECYLKMSFISWCTLTGCAVRTAEGYFSLIQSWHADTVGYKIAESRLFTDHQFSRTNRGLRRLLPHQKMERLAHPTSINEPVLRSSLREVFEVYDEGPLDEVRLQKIRWLLAGKPEYFCGMFKKELYDDLFYSGMTEFMTDGLLRPSEALPNTKNPRTGEKVRSHIHHDDVTFSFDNSGMLTKVQVMVTPIKQYGDKVGSLDKVPVPVAAFRGGTLRSAELLHILLSLSPAKKGQESTTPLFRYAKEMVEMPRRERRLHTWISHRRVMAWYHGRCDGRGVEKANHEKVKMHSFRIGGATAMMAAGVSAEEIKTRGRWASDVYQIYCRVCEGRLLSVSVLMSKADTTQFIGRGDRFFNAMAGVNDGVDAMDTDDEGEVTGGARAWMTARSGSKRSRAVDVSDDSDDDDDSDSDFGADEDDA